MSPLVEKTGIEPAPQHFKLSNLKAESICLLKANHSEVLHLQRGRALPTELLFHAELSLYPCWGPLLDEGGNFKLVTNPFF